MNFYFMTKKSNLFLYVKKNMKKIAQEEDSIHEINLCYID